MLFLRPMREGDHFPALPDKPEGLYYLALAGDTLLGWCHYYRKDQALLIMEISDGGDTDLCDGLVRAVLAQGDESGLQAACFAPACWLQLGALGLPLDEMGRLSSIQDFLYNCKSCKI